MSTFQSDQFAQRLITQDSDSPLAFYLLGEVTGALYLGSSLILYYADGRKTVITLDEDNDLFVGDIEGHEC